MDYIEVVDTEPKEMDFSSFYEDYEYESSCEEEKEEMIDFDQSNRYEEMNLKQLQRIRDYYNADIPKSKKNTKKQDVIDDILLFESNISNIDIVIRRIQLWKYIDELKADKYMKQFIFWS
jgi:hypothetical protein